MKQIQQIKLFISCPSDIKDEIDSIRFIVEEINKTVGKQNDYTIDCLNWKFDTYTDIGDDPQAVINNQIDGEYDILVGLLWQRVGVPTLRDKSGTIEEINRAISNSSKERLIYFKTTSPENLNQINLEQLSKINSFKMDLSQRGVLFKEFNSIKEFESLFRINLMNLISDKLLHNVKFETSIIKQANNVYSNQNSGIEENENETEWIRTPKLNLSFLQNGKRCNMFSAADDSIKIKLKQKPFELCIPDLNENSVIMITASWSSSLFKKAKVGVLLEETDFFSAGRGMADFYGHNGVLVVNDTAMNYLHFSDSDRDGDGDRESGRISSDGRNGGIVLFRAVANAHDSGNDNLALPANKELFIIVHQNEFPIKEDKLTSMNFEKLILSFSNTSGSSQ